MFLSTLAIHWIIFWDLVDYMSSQVILKNAETHVTIIILLQHGPASHKTIGGYSNGSSEKEFAQHELENTLRQLL